MRWVTLWCQVLSAASLHPASQGSLNALPPESTEAGKVAQPAQQQTGNNSLVLAQVEQAELQKAGATTAKANGALGPEATHVAELQKTLTYLNSDDAFKSEVEIALQKALGQLNNAGMTRNEISAILQKALAQVGSGRLPKDKIALVLIEMFPLTWYFAIDRFYLGAVRTGIAKLALSLGASLLGLIVWRCTCTGLHMMITSVGIFSVLGFVWGAVDYVAVIVNALSRSDEINCLGMRANFYHSHIQVAFALAIVALLLLPIYVFVGRFLWHIRKTIRMSRLKANAMKSPLFQHKAPIRGG
mmetsp:Transcript_2656/g.6234  ORF Transcript_2656/g.6234 Transcript_2656/m.6234 type:complete len:301 (+) Transcript_2656:64-966(+)|eukprot:CAMPEP_0171097340 /NCGR_PEP_ID=MMETSP0766_2-20121228/47489_1 /TAXON_ID=439317 /ORGANISM="Gambierdiscus australes, Strain CAWD 149" /LENGTH=300 /DNA_ID=CAMNT_0011556523 /DNA_START=64 /DNA_END=966 /DNA_ORIENTATION=+